MDLNPDALSLVISSLETLQLLRLLQLSNDFNGRFSVEIVWHMHGRFQIRQVDVSGSSTIVSNGAGQVWAWGCSIMNLGKVPLKAPQQIAFMSCPIKKLSNENFIFLHELCKNSITALDAEQSASLNKLIQKLNIENAVRFDQGGNIDQAFILPDPVLNYQELNTIESVLFALSEDEEVGRNALRDALEEFSKVLSYSEISLDTNGSLVLTPNGQVWVWCHAPHKSTLSLEHFDKVNTLHRSSFPEGVHFRKIAGDADHSLAIAADGQVWELDNTTTPQAIQFQHGITIVDIAGGGTHSLALDSRGQVWAWRLINENQPGLEPREYRSTPQKIDFLEKGVVISTIAASFKRSIAIDTLGQVWGENNHGQLGLGDNNTIIGPDKINFSQSVKILKISLGNSHTLAIDADGEVWSWGLNTKGQLGLGHNNPTVRPQKVNFSKGVKIIEVAAGGAHSVAIDRDGKVYTWGWNINGQLGLGHNENISTPQLIDITPPSIPSVDRLMQNLSLNAPECASSNSSPARAQAPFAALSLQKSVEVPASGLLYW